MGGQLSAEEQRQYLNEEYKRRARVERQQQQEMQALQEQQLQQKMSVVQPSQSASHQSPHESSRLVLGSLVGATLLTAALLVARQQSRRTPRLHGANLLPASDEVPEE